MFRVSVCQMASSTVATGKQEDTRRLDAQNTRKKKKSFRWESFTPIRGNGFRLCLVFEGCEVSSALPALTALVETSWAGNDHVSRGGGR